MTEPGPSRVGSVVASKYRLDEELGRGGMGAVYRAYHLRVHKEFAIKVLLGGVAEHRSIASRFLLEAQAAGRIGHPGILDVYDVGEDADGTPFIVMELLRGETLASLVRRERLEVDVACWIAMELLDILEAAHRHGIIHRDVKLQNVFLTEVAAAASSTKRGVKLLDFGIAKFSEADGATALTRSGEIIGSPLYMSPEQAKGIDVDVRADVWSVGAMLFEMLTGRCAHTATTPIAVLSKILTEPAPPPSSLDGRITPDLDAVVAKALQIDRTQRWASGREMRDALDEVRRLRGTAGTVPEIPPAPPHRSIPPMSANERTPGAITSTIAALDAPHASELSRRPWSSAPAREERLAVVGAAAGHLSTTAPMLVGSRARLFVGATAAISAVVLIGWYLGTRSVERSVATAPIVSTGASASTMRPTPPSSETVIASASPTPPAVTSSAAAAYRPVAPAPVLPKCEPGEVLSRGHCCARGLEWQTNRCERPLATTF